MFGTVGHLRLKPENRDRLVAELSDPVFESVEGYRRSYLLFDENDPEHAILAVAFDDRETYFRNADDPAQDERYRRMRALLEEDPTWTDGEWIVGPAK